MNAARSASKGAVLPCDSDECFARRDSAKRAESLLAHVSMTTSRSPFFHGGPVFRRSFKYRALLVVLIGSAVLLAEPKQGQAATRRDICAGNCQALTNGCS